MMIRTKQTNDVSCPQRSDRGPSRWIGGLVALAVALTAGSAFAQAPPVKKIDVHGTVVNATSGKPVAGAYVSLSGARWGTVTGDHGRFTLRRVRPGHVSVTANQLGYKTVEWDGVIGPQHDTLKIPLAPKPKLLHGLEVENARFARRRRSTAASVISFNQGQLATTNWDNVLDFVNARGGLINVPCWDGSQGCYWVEGQTIYPIVYVDEQPVADGMDYLRTMWPQDLYLVEVYAHGAEIRVYTKPFMKQAARSDFQPIAIGF